MSEYQYYEFLALDQPLTDKQMREVRSFSTRARITPTSFVNEYHWGSFKGDIGQFMAKYYDAFVYVTNWGTHELRFRLPRAGVDEELADQYCVSDEVQLHMAGKYAIVSLFSEDESGDWEEDGDRWMSCLAPLRADLLAGDLRCLYLGWLSSVGCLELDDEEVEPHVPAGLGELTAPLRALTEFLRIDESLIESATEASEPLSAEGDSADMLQAWIEAVPARDKNTLLYPLTQEPPAAVQREIIRRFRARQPLSREASPAGRTVGQLLAAAEQRTQEKKRLDAEKRNREEAHQRVAAERIRRMYLDGLAKRLSQTWQTVDALIATRQPNNYDEAVQLLCDHRDLCEREGKAAQAASRLVAPRAAHSRKPTLIRRLDNAKL